MSGIGMELSTLPAPCIVEELSSDRIFASIWKDFIASYPDFSALLESDPAVKLIEVAAYREMLLRNRINIAARGQLLAYAAGTDLDHLAAFYGVERLAGEGDERLRLRIQLRIKGFSNAGGRDLYRYWALTASLEVADAYVDSPQAGPVRISILSRVGDGTAADVLLDAVKTLVLRDDIRVLTDTVHVVSAQIIPVHVEADIWLYPESVIEVLEALPEYLSAQCSIAASLGWDCTRSWLISRLHIAGVHRVALAEPAYDVVVEGYQYAHLVGCTLRYAGRGR